MSLNKKDSKMGYLLFLPAIFIILLIVLYPTLFAFYLSFTNFSLSNFQNASFIGISNYLKILTESQYWDSLKNGLVFTVGSIIPQLVLALLLANLLNYKHLKFKRFFRGIMILPWLVPTVTGAMIWKWMFNDLYGVFNHILMNIGLISRPITWLAQSNTAMLSLIITNVWRGLPLMMIMFLAGLQSIPEQMYEAGEVDGATAWQKFTKITLPQLKPVIGVAVILRTIWIFNYYDLPWVMTSGGPASSTTTMPLYAYITSFSGYRLGKGSAITVTMFFILLLFSFVYFKFYVGEEE